MKNLPEKIYLNLNMTPQEVVETKDKDFHEATKTWEITWSEERLSEHDPEYVRKDEFIEKACRWLTKNVDKYLYNTGGIDEYIPKCGDKMFEDFKKYLKN